MGLSFLKVQNAKLKVLSYGRKKGTTIVLVHGGPGAAGYMHSLGKLFKRKYHIIEYYQRSSFSQINAEPITISDHINDLKFVLRKYCKKNKAILIGHSWGSALCLMFAKQHYELLKKIILISFMPLDQKSTTQFSKNIDCRLSKQEINKKNRILKQLNSEISLIKKSVLYKKYAELVLPVYNKIKVSKLEITEFDYASCHLPDELINNKCLINCLMDIKIPVWAFHGDYDPLPLNYIKKILTKKISNLKFIALKNCGHIPWFEQNISQKFVKELNSAILA